MYVSGGHVPYRSKPAILEIGNAATRGDANAPSIILKDGLHGIVRQSTTSLAINRNVAVIPSVQAITTTEPNAAVLGPQDGRNEGIGQPLLHRNRGDGKVAKAVETITVGDPDIAFTILKETVNVIPGEAVRPRKQIGPSPVYMQHPPPYRSDPQTSIAIPEQPNRL
jgi:hypothetical protein